jgi:hypothetical protein
MQLTRSIRPKENSDGAEPIPSGAWRVVVVNQAQLLEDEFKRVAPRPVPDPASDIVRENLERARSAATAVLALGRLGGFTGPYSLGNAARRYFPPPARNRSERRSFPRRLDVSPALTKPPRRPMAQ